MRKLFIAPFFITLLLSTAGCGKEMTEQERSHFWAEYVASQIKYTKDKRTTPPLCFGYDSVHNGYALTLVPCSAVEHLIP